MISFTFLDLCGSDGPLESNTGQNHIFIGLRKDEKHGVSCLSNPLYVFIYDISSNRKYNADT